MKPSRSPKEFLARRVARLRFGQSSSGAIQAAISAVHVEANVASETDWAQFVALYDVLLRADSSPVVELNRAVAIAMRDDVATGLSIIDAILSRPSKLRRHRQP